MTAQGIPARLGNKFILPNAQISCPLTKKVNSFVLQHVKNVPLQPPRQKT
jgi:hypothetical protein